MLPLLLTLALAAPAATPAAPAPSRADVHALVERVLKAYGGRKALERVHAVRMEGTVFSIMRHSQTHTVRVFERPDRFKSLVAYESGAEARLTDGHDVWRNDPGGPLEPASGAMSAAVRLQAVRADVPWLLAEREADLAILPDAPPPHELAKREDGKPTPLLAVSLPLADGLAFRAWIDANGHVLQSQGLMDKGGMQTHFETLYTDFRDVNGVTFAFHEQNWASGMQTGITTLEKVTINPEIRPDEFVPPRSTGSGGDHPEK